MRLFVPVVILLALAACSTPVTVMQHPDTKQVVTCDQGNNYAGTLQGGWHYRACVEQHNAAGFVPVGE